MRKKILSSVFIIALLFGCNGKKEEPVIIKPTPPISTETVVDIISELKNADSKMVLVQAHRGDWKNAPENSLEAIRKCIEMGVDIVEIDVQKTKDGILILMHDETVNRTTTGTGLVSNLTLAEIKALYLKKLPNLSISTGTITAERVPTLKEAMELMKGKVLVNLDKGYSYVNEINAVLAETDTYSQAIIKGGVSVSTLQADWGTTLNKLMYFPIVVLGNSNAESVISSFQSTYKPAAIEVTFDSDNIALVNQFFEIRRKGSRVSVATIGTAFAGGRTDTKAVNDPEANYGWLVNKGANIIMTDEPAYLLRFLKEKGLHK